MLFQSECSPKDSGIENVKNHPQGLIDQVKSKISYMRFGVFISILLIVSVLLSGCSKKSEFERKLQEGLDSEKEVNEIFLGYEFGMSREEFLELSWEMNQQQVITGGVNIVYLLKDLKSTVRLEFYPHFQDGVISKMPVSASYISWSPWNEQYNSDELLKDLKDYYEVLYSTTFSQIDVPGIESTVWISIEGNREIRMYKKSVNTIQVDFIDLSQVYQN